MKNTVIDTLIARRSTRRYKPEPILSEELNDIIEAGRYAPSGGNSQTNHLIVITNQEVLKKLVELVTQEFAKMQWNPDMYKSMQHSIKASQTGNYNFLYSAPTLVVVANQKNYPNAMADSACVLQNMMIAATSLSVGSCWINQLHWLDENPIIREMMLSLGMKEEETVCGALALGYPEVMLNKPLERTGNPVTYIE